jgi:hypothetical protein
MSDSSNSSGSQASESSAEESKKNSIQGTKSLSKTESQMSVSTPKFIAETETWQLRNGRLQNAAPAELPFGYKRNITGPFEELTSTRRISELNKLLEANKKTVIDPTCVRTTSNWATISPHNKFDKLGFDANATKTEIAYKSPKLAKILQNIRKFDREDEARYGRRFKHFVFSDIKGSQGAKAVAAALLGEGYNLGYNVRKAGKKTQITVKSEEELLQTKGKNFFLLSSVSIYGEPLRVAVKKDALKKFNMRPSNVYGDLAHIIVMDSGFKEGIDLFDIKYVHIFEPQTTAADQKQVIGRGTRTCGQKGLQFNPRVGWPLYVMKYDLSIAPEYRPDFHGAETAFQYYLQSKNIDIRLLNLANSLETLAIKGSVDYRLNKPIHEFSADKNAVLSRGGSAHGDVFWGGARKDTNDESDGDSDDELEHPPKQLVAAEENLRRKLSENSRPGKKYKAVKRYIKKYFSENKWPPVTMENLCGYEGPPMPPLVAKTLDLIPQPMPLRGDIGIKMSKDGKTKGDKTKGGAPNLITLSPTQEFISTYFTAELPIKGMVLWQSVGTGKTCTAIATATRQFEPLGYTILWVTRTTLKNDIWKNMFDMVCHEDIRNKVQAGITIPEDMPGRMRLLSKSWGVRPISYKQFSNLVSQNNQYYDQLVKRNGDQDPLRKTLLIIDEAHKLYGGGDLSSIERPDMPAFHRALMNSYAVSGKDSVRVLFMTATPITENPLELVKLVNLCRPAEQQIPTEFEEFADRFLDDKGDFTDVGGKMFLDDIAGHISYLNREGDVRQFARPILREVAVPLVDKKTAKDIEDFDVIGASLLDKHAEELRVVADEAKTKYDTALEGFKKGNAVKVEKVCMDYPEEQRDACYKLAKLYTNRMIKTAKERTNEWKEQMTNFAKDLRDAKKVKSDKFKFVRQTRKDNPLEFKEYQRSTYYKLKECEKEWKDAPNFDKFLETQPVFSRAKDLENTVKEELVNVELQLKSDVSSQQKRIRSYNHLLKTDLSPLETRVVRSSIADAKTRLDKTKKRNVKWLNRMTKRANSSIDYLKKFQKNTKKEIRKVIKEQTREDKAFAREEAKERKLDETADADLTDTFKESLKEAQDAVRAEMTAKSDKFYDKAAKKAAAQEKKQNAATRKLEKALEKEEKQKAQATRKQRVALDKQQKAQDKEKEKARKLREKEEEKSRLRITPDAKR